MIHSFIGQVFTESLLGPELVTWELSVKDIDEKKIADQAQLQIKYLHIRVINIF